LDKPAIYRIKVLGFVPEHWADRLGSMKVVGVKQKITALEGWMPDQAALKGVLDTLFQLHLPLLEVTCFPNSWSIVSASHPENFSHG
jgi:hypothetical protein